MRWLQNMLLLIGATALGSAWGCIAIALLGAVTVFRARSGEDWGTAFGMMYAGACCGLPLGALAGFAGALDIAREESEDWSRDGLDWRGAGRRAGSGGLSLRGGPGSLGPDERVDRLRLPRRCSAPSAACWQRPARGSGNAPARARASSLRQCSGSASRSSPCRCCSSL